MRLRITMAWLALTLGGGCIADFEPLGEEGSGATTGGGSSSDATSTSGTGVPTDTETETGTGPGSSSGSTGPVDYPEPEGPWGPGTVYPTPAEPNERGFLDRRGLVHTHSIYSHDACDEMPHDGNFNYDEVCREDLRRGLCETRHDFVFFTDHDDSFSRNEYPAVLQYDEARGDKLVEHDAAPTANRSHCETTRPVLLMAGVEGATMPIGLEQHVPERSDIYGERTADAVDTFREYGAITLVSHTEDWTVEELIDLGLDGFEMYNLHANLFLNLGAGLQLLALLAEGGEGLPHSDLAIFPLWSEDEAYISRWGTVLARGHRRVTTMGTDAHRNSFPQLLPDGERIDSFRRMMLWFSNHALVQPTENGAWDDRQLKQAVREGRLYGVFEYMGYAEGFDAYVESGDDILEIGASVPTGGAPRIVAVAPTVLALDPAADAPEITLHLMHAIEGGFEEVASGGNRLEYSPVEPGAYRVEVRMTPLHLQGMLGDYADLALEPRVWIYANPFYVEG